MLDNNSNVSTPAESARTYRPLLIATVITIIIVVIYSIPLPRLFFYFHYSEVELLTLEHIGSFIAGLSSIITIVWLIATFLIQINELSLQRKELFLQRQAWESTSAVMRVEVIRSLLPQLRHRLTSQATAIASNLDINVPQDVNVITFLYTHQQLATEIIAAQRGGDIITSIHVNGYINIYDEFVKLSLHHLTPPWTLQFIIPDEDQIVALHSKLKEIVSQLSASAPSPEFF